MATSPATAIIPARLGSTRFPEKVLADRTGKPLIQHVYEQTQRSALIDRVIVATDSERVADAVRRFGGEAQMTRDDHPNGSCRVAEVAATLACDVVVNVQGDEPEIDPASLDAAIDLLRQRPECVVATLAAPLSPDENPGNSNIVKVVIDRQQRALYFSRALVPFARDDSTAASPRKHIGVYVYRRPFLLQYVMLAPTPLEQTECLEQLRILEHGHSIAVAEVPAHRHGIDTPEQYDAFVTRYQSESAAD